MGKSGPIVPNAESNAEPNFNSWIEIINSKLNLTQKDLIDFEKYPMVLINTVELALKTTGDIQRAIDAVFERAFLVTFDGFLMDMVKYGFKCNAIRDGGSNKLEIFLGIIETKKTVKVDNTPPTAAIAATPTATPTTPTTTTTTTTTTPTTPTTPHPTTDLILTPHEGETYGYSPTPTDTTTIPQQDFINKPPDNYTGKKRELLLHMFDFNDKLKINPADMKYWNSQNNKKYYVLKIVPKPKNWINDNNKAIIPQHILFLQMYGYILMYIYHKISDTSNAMSLNDSNNNKKSNTYSLLGHEPINSTQMFMEKFNAAFEILSRSLRDPRDDEALLTQEPIIRRIYIAYSSFINNILGTNYNIRYPEHEPLHYRNDEIAKNSDKDLSELHEDIKELLFSLNSEDKVIIEYLKKIDPRGFLWDIWSESNEKEEANEQFKYIQELLNILKDNLIDNLGQDNVQDGESKETNQDGESKETKTSEVRIATTQTIWEKYLIEKKKEIKIFKKPSGRGYKIREYFPLFWFTDDNVHPSLVYKEQSGGPLKVLGRDEYIPIDKSSKKQWIYCEDWSNEAIKRFINKVKESAIDSNIEIIEIIEIIKKVEPYLKKKARNPKDIIRFKKFNDNVKEYLQQFDKHFYGGGGNKTNDPEEEETTESSGRSYSGGVGSSSRPTSASSATATTIENKSAIVVGTLGSPTQEGELAQIKMKIRIKIVKKIDIEKLNLHVKSSFPTRKSFEKKIIEFVDDKLNLQKEMEVLAAKLKEVRKAAEAWGETEKNDEEDDEEEIKNPHLHFELLKEKNESHPVYKFFYSITDDLEILRNELKEQQVIKEEDFVKNAESIESQNKEISRLSDSIMKLINLEHLTEVDNFIRVLDTLDQYLSVSDIDPFEQNKQLMEEIKKNPEIILTEKQKKLILEKPEDDHRCLAYWPKNLGWSGPRKETMLKDFEENPLYFKNVNFIKYVFCRLYEKLQNFIDKDTDFNDLLTYDFYLGLLIVLPNWVNFKLPIHKGTERIKKFFSISPEDWPTTDKYAPTLKKLIKCLVVGDSNIGEALINDDNQHQEELKNGWVRQLKIEKTRTLLSLNLSKNNLRWLPTKLGGSRKIRRKKKPKLSRRKAKNKKLKLTIKIRKPRKRKNTRKSKY